MDLSSLTPLAGGWSGQTFLSEIAGERAVVRIHADHSGPRGAAAAEVDAALLRLVRGLVPVPEVLELRPARPDEGLPALLVTSYVTGERGDLVLPRLDDAGLRRLGAGLGRVAADLAGMPMPRPGPFLDGELRIGSFGDLSLPDSLPELVAGSALPGFDATARAGLLAVAEAAQDLLDTIGRCSLVHGDLNPKNVIVDPGSLEVLAVLDWEFAHAGHPYTDLGNLLRFDRRPAYVEATLGAFCDRRGGTPGEALHLARAADLWALVDLAARAGENPVADRAHERLLLIAGAGDPSAA